VDNAPLEDETRLVFDDVVGGDLRFSYLVEPLPGLSRSRNRGLAAARFDKVAFTDDDVVVDPAWLHGLARGFLREPGVVCVTGLVPAGSLESAAERYFAHRVSWADHLQPRRYDSVGRRSPFFPFDVALFGTGANFAADRCALMNVCGFDEALGAGTKACGGEDLDIFARLLRAGGILAYEPSAIVWHFRNAQDSELPRQMRSYGIGFATHVLKQLRDPAVRHGLVRQFPSIIGEITRRWFRHSRAVPRGREFVAAEISGWLLGPLAYHRSRRALDRRGAPRP
jgi:cellulose synthase/poly-beta-1,6-N-acetylglucosamine synthase-like glycosyltransferase